MTHEIEFDRRKSQRKLFHTGARLILQNSSFFNARTLDLSMTGVSIVTAVVPPQGAACTIKFSVPLATRGSRNIEVAARIIYSILSGPLHGFRTGLEFMDVLPEVGSAIKSFIEL